MKKVVLLLYLSTFIRVYSVNQEHVYQDIRSRISSETGEISSRLSQLGITNSKKRIECIEACKMRAFKDDEPELYDRLHEEILYVKDPWYKKRPWLAPLITSLVVGWAVASGDPNPRR